MEAGSIWNGGTISIPRASPQKRELEYASSQLTAIEINGTYYGSQKPESFRKWHDETPKSFIFTVKGPRFATNRRVLAESGGSIEKFFASGVTELKEKLGPVNWQFMATKKFDAGDFEAFLKLLPKKVDGLAIRHAVEVRHDSFKDKEFVELCRKHGVGIVFGADSEFPLIADVTADFIYARIMGTQAKEKLGYPPAILENMGAARERLGERRIPESLHAAGPSRPQKEARCLPVRDQRRQGTQSRRRPGDHRRALATTVPCAQGGDGQRPELRRASARKNGSAAMQLIGMLDSPYVRRVAVSLKVLGLPFELDQVSVFRQFDKFSSINPVVKAPSFVTDDGVVLMDSSLILEHIAHLAPRSLMPADRAAHEIALRQMGLALAGCEKTVSILYERSQRPAEKQHQPWLDRVLGQFCRLMARWNGKPRPTGSPAKN